MTNLSRARERVEAYCTEMDRPNSPFRSEDEIQASIWDKADGQILSDDLRTILDALDGLGRGDEPISDQRLIK